MKPCGRPSWPCFRSSRIGISSRRWRPSRRSMPCPARLASYTWISCCASSLGATQLILEAFVRTKYKYQSDFAVRHRVEGIQDAVVKLVLEGRGSAGLPAGSHLRDGRGPVARADCQARPCNGRGSAAHPRARAPTGLWRHTMTVLELSDERLTALYEGRQGSGWDGEVATSVRGGRTLVRGIPSGPSRCSHRGGAGEAGWGLEPGQEEWIQRLFATGSVCKASSSVWRRRTRGDRTCAD